jgi:cytoskeleton protein RodZ
MSATATDIRTSIGARLKAGRERVGMTLLQLAEKLHVDPKVLEALETDQFDQLGAPVYVRGHIKRYAELVNENGPELVAHYSAITKPVMPDLTQLPKAAHHADLRKLVLPSLVVLIAFALVGMVWWILQNVQSTPSAGPQPVPVATDAEGTTVVPSDVSSGDASGGDSGAPAGEAPGVAGNREPASAGQPATPGSTQGTGARPGASSSAAPGADASPNAPPSGAGARPNATPSGASARPSTASGSSALASAAPRRALVGNPPPRAGTTAGAVSIAQISKASLKRDAQAASDRARGRSVSVTLKFSADSWAEVYDSKGERLFYDIGAANSSHSLTGSPPLRVVLGNAPAVSLDINGKAAKVPASVMQDSGAQFTINRSGRIRRARSDGG